MVLDCRGGLYLDFVRGESCDMRNHGVDGGGGVGGGGARRGGGLPRCRRKSQVAVVKGIVMASRLRVRLRIDANLTTRHTAENLLHFVVSTI